MFCEKKNEKVKDDFEEAIGFLYQEERANIIFEFYYSQLNTQKSKIKLLEESIIHYPSTSVSNLDFDLNVIQVSDF